MRWRQSFTVGGHRERGVGERSGREERGVAVGVAVVREREGDA